MLLHLPPMAITESDITTDWSIELDTAAPGLRMGDDGDAADDADGDDGGDTAGDDGGDTDGGD